MYYTPTTRDEWNALKKKTTTELEALGCRRHTCHGTAWLMLFPARWNRFIPSGFVVSTGRASSPFVAPDDNRMTFGYLPFGVKARE